MIASCYCIAIIAELLACEINVLKYANANNHEVYWDVINDMVLSVVFDKASSSNGQAGSTSSYLPLSV